jgi:hypothetical protein
VEEAEIIFSVYPRRKAGKLLKVISNKELYLLRCNAFSPLEVNRRFGRTYRLHFQDRKISRARSQRKSR